MACSADGTHLVAAADDSYGTGRIYVSPPLAPPAPALDISWTSTNTLLVSWPSASTGWTLEEKTNLTDNNWSPPSEPVMDDGTNKSITVSPDLHSTLYRLYKP